MLPTSWYENQGFWYLGFWLTVASVLAIIFYRILINFVRTMFTFYVFYWLVQPAEREGRRYICGQMPAKIEGQTDAELARHVQTAHRAFVAFESIGYFHKTAWLHEKIFLRAYWPNILRCWLN
jgi:hypothetical protein